MDEDVSAMIDEECRLRVMGSGNSMKPAYVAIKDRSAINMGKGDIRVTIVPIQEVVVVEVELVEVGGVLVRAMEEVVVIVVEAVVKAVVAQGPMWRLVRILSPSL
jgi:hypothetical protein